MLSEDLASLAALLRENPGMAIAPVTARAIGAALDTAVRDAQALERQAVPPAARVTELTGNVVPLRA